MGCSLPLSIEENTFDAGQINPSLSKSIFERQGT